MIRSMTAFASGERATEWGTLGCELRSVNHRFLEIGVRLHDDLRALEPALRFCRYPEGGFAGRNEFLAWWSQSSYPVFNRLHEMTEAD